MIAQRETPVPRCGWLVLLPSLLFLSGCLWPEQTKHVSFLKRLQSKTFSPDHALIEVALIERPLGDPYINEKIWERADELIDQESRGALDENGLRIGQLVGSLPGDLQQMLLSKQCNSNPHGLVFPAGKTVPIYLGTVLPHSSYDFVQGNSRKEVNLDQARYCLDVSAQFLNGGRTKLTFTPKVENGEPILPFRAVPERSTWEVSIEKACKKYSDLAWDVTLGPNQYFVVGARAERERTLGRTAFTEARGAESVQRLLVIRNCRSVTSHEAHGNTVEDLVRADKMPPLALQATIPVSRATAN
jgi:hypothetical protein